MKKILLAFSIFLLLPLNTMQVEANIDIDIQYEEDEVRYQIKILKRREDTLQQLKSSNSVSPKDQEKIEEIQQEIVERKNNIAMGQKAVAKLKREALKSNAGEKLICVNDPDYPGCETAKTEVTNECSADSTSNACTKETEPDCSKDQSAPGCITDLTASQNKCADGDQSACDKVDGEDVKGTKKYIKKTTDSSEIFGDRTILDQKIDIKNYIKDGCEGKEIRCLVEKIIGYIKKLIIPIAILLLIFSGIYLLVVRTDEEAYKKAKNEILGMMAGFVVILLAATLIDSVFFGTEGQILQEGSNLNSFGGALITQIDGFISFLLTFVVPIGVLVIVVSAIQLILGGGEDEAMGKLKKRIIYVIVGIIVILLANTTMTTFFNPSTGAISLPETSKLLMIITRWINWMLGFIGVFGVFAIVWAGFRMITHFGDDEAVENSKTIIKMVVIGLFVAFSSWTIIRFFLMAGNN